MTKVFDQLMAGVLKLVVSEKNTRDLHYDLKKELPSLKWRGSGFCANLRTRNGALKRTVQLTAGHVQSSVKIKGSQVTMIRPVSAEQKAAKEKTDQKAPKEKTDQKAPMKEESLAGETLKDIHREDSIDICVHAPSDVTQKLIDDGTIRPFEVYRNMSELVAACREKRVKNLHVTGYNAGQGLPTTLTKKSSDGEVPVRIAGDRRALVSNMPLSIYGGYSGGPLVSEGKIASGETVYRAYGVNTSFAPKNTMYASVFTQEILEYMLAAEDEEVCPIGAVGWQVQPSEGTYYETKQEKAQGKRPVGAVICSVRDDSPLRHCLPPKIGSVQGAIVSAITVGKKPWQYTHKINQIGCIAGTKITLEQFIRGHTPNTLVTMVLHMPPEKGGQAWSKPIQASFKLVAIERFSRIRNQPSSHRAQWLPRITSHQAVFVEVKDTDTLNQHLTSRYQKHTVLSRTADPEFKRLQRSRNFSGGLIGQFGKLHQVVLGSLPYAGRIAQDELEREYIGKMIASVNGTDIKTAAALQTLLDKKPSHLIIRFTDGRWLGINKKGQMLGDSELQEKMKALNLQRDEKKEKGKPTSLGVVKAKKSQARAHHDVEHSAEIVCRNIAGRFPTKKAPQHLTRQSSFRTSGVIVRHPGYKGLIALSSDNTLGTAKPETITVTYLPRGATKFITFGVTGKHTLSAASSQALLLCRQFSYQKLQSMPPAKIPYESVPEGTVFVYFKLPESKVELVYRGAKKAHRLTYTLTNALEKEELAKIKQGGVPYRLRREFDKHLAKQPAVQNSLQGIGIDLGEDSHGVEAHPALHSLEKVHTFSHLSIVQQRQQYNPSDLIVSTMDDEDVQEVTLRSTQPRAVAVTLDEQRPERMPSGYIMSRPLVIKQEQAKERMQLRSAPVYGQREGTNDVHWLGLTKPSNHLGEELKKYLSKESRPVVENTFLIPSTTLFFCLSTVLQREGKAKGAFREMPFTLDKDFRVIYPHPAWAHLNYRQIKKVDDLTVNQGHVTISGTPVPVSMYIRFLPLSRQKISIEHSSNDLNSIEETFDLSKLVPRGQPFAERFGRPCREYRQGPLRLFEKSPQYLLDIEWFRRAYWTIYDGTSHKMLPYYLAPVFPDGGLVYEGAGLVLDLAALPSYLSQVDDSGETYPNCQTIDLINNIKPRDLKHAISLLSDPKATQYWIQCVSGQSICLSRQFLTQWQQKKNTARPAPAAVGVSLSAKVEPTELTNAAEQTPTKRVKPRA